MPIISAARSGVDAARRRGSSRPRRRAAGRSSAAASSEISGSSCSSSPSASSNSASHAACAQVEQARCRSGRERRRAARPSVGGRGSQRTRRPAAPRRACPVPVSHASFAGQKLGCRQAAGAVVHRARVEPRAQLLSLRGRARGPATGARASAAGRARRAASRLCQKQEIAGRRRGRFPRRRAPPRTRRPARRRRARPRRPARDALRRSARAGSPSSRPRSSNAQTAGRRAADVQREHPHYAYDAWPSSSHPTCARSSPATPLFDGVSFKVERRDRRRALRPERRRQDDAAADARRRERAFTAASSRSRRARASRCTTSGRRSSAA